MQVDANVSEKDIGEVKLGDKATSTVESFAKHPFTGEVTQISQSPRKIEDAVTYNVVISAPNPDLLLKPGMTATIRIVVDRRDDVLRAPDQTSLSGIPNPRKQFGRKLKNRPSGWKNSMIGSPAVT